MRAETVNQIAEQSAGRETVPFWRSCRSQLDKRVLGAHAALELQLCRIQFFVFFMPHQFDIANRAGIVQEQKEVLEKLQILLELPL